MKKEREKNKGRNTAIHYADESPYSEGNGEPLLHLTSTFLLKSKHEPPITVHPFIEDKNLKVTE